MVLKEKSKEDGREKQKQQDIAPEDL